MRFKNSKLIIFVFIFIILTYSHLSLLVHVVSPVEWNGLVEKSLSTGLLHDGCHFYVLFSFVLIHTVRSSLHPFIFTGTHILTGTHLFSLIYVHSHAVYRCILHPCTRFHPLAFIPTCTGRRAIHLHLQHPHPDHSLGPPAVSHTAVPIPHSRHPTALVWILIRLYDRV